MIIHIAGGAKIGASATIFETKHTTFAIDWGGGLAAGKQKPQYEKMKKIKHVLLTHAHSDHVGNVMELVRNSRAYFHCSMATYDLFIQTLINARYQQEDLNVFAGRAIIYNHGDSLSFAQGVYVYPVAAGHILGASSYQMMIDGISIFYTGDMCLHDQALVTGAMLPDRQVNVLMREATYVDREGVDYQTEANRFVRTIREMFDRQMKILIPALAMGRMQEVACLLYKAGVPFCIEGARDFRRIYAEHLGSDAAFLTKIPEFVSMKDREDRMASSEGAVILASSGMLLDNTFSARWANWIAPRTDGAILLVNHQDPEAVGGQIQQIQDGQCLMVNGKPTVKGCMVERFELPAHLSGSNGLALERSCTNTDSQILLSHYPSHKRALAFVQAQSDCRHRKVVTLNERIEL